MSRSGPDDMSLGSTVVEAANVRPEIPDHQLLRRIGEGSYGEVWLARTVMGGYRAVKIVYRRSFEDERPYEREFKGILRFEPISRAHDGQVDILHVGRNDQAGYFFYMMELADDLHSGPEIKPEIYCPKTLKSVLVQRGRLPFAETLQIGINLTAALEHLHSHSLVHRDIKPSNIVFISGAPKLADIGLVADISEARSFVGTEGFIPPEGPGKVQADLFSLGKVLYQISLAQKDKIFPELPDDFEQLPDKDRLLELNEIILKACENDLQVRYQSATEMHDDLALLQGGKSVKRLRLVERRLALATRLGVVIAGLMVVAVGAYLFQSWQARQVAREKQRAERLLYVADMNLAHQAFEAGNVVRAKTLLEAHRPKPGTDDLRNFEWYHVNYLCQDDPFELLTGHSDAVNSVAVSPDGKMVASGSADKTVKLWNLRTRRLITTLTGHSESVNSVSFSADGTTLASGSSDHTIKLWSLSTRKPIRSLTNHTAAVNAVAFSPDGKWLASGSDDRTLRLWDTIRFHESLVFTNYGGRVTALSFSQDGQQLVSGGYGGGVSSGRPSGSGWGATLTIYDLVRHEQIDRLFDLPGEIFSVSISPDGKFVAASMNYLITLWDLARGQMITRLKGHTHFILTVMFSPDGIVLATGGDDATVRLWDLFTRQTIATFKGHKGSVNSLAFSPDGKTLISGGRDSTLKLWDLSSLRDRDILRGHEEGAYSVAFSPDDKILASASHDRTVKLWDVESGGLLATLTNHTDVVTSVAFSPDGETLYSGGLDRTIRAWHWRARTQIGLFVGHTQRISCFALSPDGRTLVSGTGWWNETLRPSELIFWDVETRAALTNIPQTGMIHSIRIFPDGKTVASLDQKFASLWDVASRQALFSVARPAGHLSLSPSPDGRFLVLAGPNDEIKLWDVASRAIAATLPIGIPIWGFGFSPDGKRLAVSLLNGQVRLWDLETWRDTVTLSGHETGGFAVVFSHDGQTLATSGVDHTRLWRAPRVERAHSGPKKNP